MYLSSSFYLVTSPLTGCATCWRLNKYNTVFAMGRAGPWAMGRAGPWAGLGLKFWDFNGLRAGLG